MRCRTPFPLLSAAASLAVAGCVAPPRQAPPPPAPPVAVVVPPAPSPAPADWRDRPHTPGDWHHVADPARPAARYRSPEGVALLTLDCDRPARTVSISLPGPAAALTIRTTSTARTLPTRASAVADAATPAVAVATLPAADPLLDAMAFSRGRFSVEQPGRAPLTLPPWAEVGRLVQDCRA